jgi:hypothetical protein
LKGDVEISSTKIGDEDVAHTRGLIIETVDNSGSGGLADDTEDVQSADKTGPLGGLTLGVVEVSGDGDDGVDDGIGITKVRPGGLLHSSVDWKQS